MSVSTELKTVLDAFEDPRLLVRSDYSVAYANRAFVKRYGRQNYEGRSCHELLFQKSMRCADCGERCPLDETAVTGKTEAALRRVLGSTGVRYLEVTSTPLRGADGRPVLFMEAIADRNGTQEPLCLKGVVARSSAVKALLQKIAQVTALDVPVLFTGPSGSGKREFARLLHENSRRAAHPFLTVDCLGLTPERLSRELRLTGPFGLSGGTLYLKEVADLSFEMQTAVLRLLETGSWACMDGERCERADIRLLCGSRMSLKTLRESGRLGDELFYRLSVCALRVPGLDERVEDLEELSRLVLEGLKLRGFELGLSDDALHALSRRSWSGHVRELQALLERAAIFGNGCIVGAEDLPEVDVPASSSPEPVCEEDVQAVLRDWTGSRAALAARLGVSERTVYRWLERNRRVKRPQG